MNTHRHAGVVAAICVALAACGGGESQQQAQAEQEAAAAEMAADPQQAQAPAELPEGVTPEMVAGGKQIFGGAGICFTCHGQDGKGIPNLGADLTDGEWLQSDGSYAAIVQTITEGVPAEKSSTGTPMPAKGGTQISEEQVKAVAAYVWSLSHGGS